MNEIVETLAVITVLQKAASKCFHNTRAVMIYLSSGEPLTIEGSCIFRVEKASIGGCVFRVLRKEDDKYISTNIFFTMNAEFICCLRCLCDTTVKLNRS